MLALRLPVAGLGWCQVRAMRDVLWAVSVMRFPFVTFDVTPEHMATRWSGAKDGRWFRCHLCGEFFAEGDKVRAVYSNFVGSPFGGNPLVHSGPDCGTGTDAEILAELGRRKDALPWWSCPWGSEPPGRPETKAVLERVRESRSRLEGCDGRGG